MAVKSKGEEVKEPEATENPTPAKEPKKAYRLTRGSVSIEKPSGERRHVGIGGKIHLTDAEAKGVLAKQIVPWDDTAVES